VTTVILIQKWFVCPLIVVGHFGIAVGIQPLNRHETIVLECKLDAQGRKDLRHKPGYFRSYAGGIVFPTGIECVSTWPALFIHVLYRSRQRYGHRHIYSHHGNQRSIGIVHFNSINTRFHAGNNETRAILLEGRLEESSRLLDYHDTRRTCTGCCYRKIGVRPMPQ